MSQQRLSQKRWQGIADYSKESANGQIPNTAYFMRAIDYRNDPQVLTLLPGAVKESGSVVTDLLKWGDLVPTVLTSYLYGDSGNVYSRTSAGVWTKLFMAASSHGNGLAYFSGDDYIYYTCDSTLGRYGTIQGGSPQSSDDFLKAAGGIPTNTYSLSLTAASSMYGHAADSTSLSITGDITLEAFFKLTTLPAVGAQMALIGKWDENANTRSYLMDIYGVSGYFGDGSDSSLTISSDTTEAPIDSACTGTAAATTLSATNASFAAGQVILIHQTQGTNAGQWERNTISGYTAGTITLGTALLGTYTTGAQVRVLKQYTNVTINSGKTYTAKAWNGTVGGILAFLASGTVTGTGNISAAGKGFRGGTGANAGSRNGYTGESNAGTYIQQQAANGNGGGGGTYVSSDGGGGGGGGANGSVGSNGHDQIASHGGKGGTGATTTTGSSDLTTMTFGGGGGQGGSDDSGLVQNGAAGGGIVFIIGATITISGSISANGSNGAAANSGQGGGGGGGAGGSVLIKGQTVTLGSSLITATGGTGGADAGDGSLGGGGNGGDGRCHLDYYTSYTGTFDAGSGTATYAQDNSLVTNTTYEARLGVSNDGTAFEFLAYALDSLTTGVWNRLSISWVASTSTASFYLNGALIGTRVGTKTAIADTAALLYVGADKGASAVEDFLNGKIDDVRVWNLALDATTILANNSLTLTGGEAGLVAYYQFNNAATDSTSNSNDLTLVNSPTYSTDVPFSGATSRLDIDSSSTGASTNNYTLLTTISENSADKLTITPVNDPQKSIAFQVDTVGTGNWTVTIHDEQNNQIATATIANANIPTATNFAEFIFSTPWRIVSGRTYHAHLTVSTGTSKVRTVTSDDFSTAYFYDYFGFLVTDTQFHPIIQFQYQPLGGTLTGAMIIGNERYIAVWDGANFDPNFIQFPPGWRVRCFAQWRQYLAIGVWRGGNIYDFHQGRIYFWSGYQPAYDFFIDVPEGQINALFGVDSDLYMFAGYRGILLDYKGGYFYNTGNSSSNKLKRMPLLETSAYTETYPGALNMWRGMLHFGLYTNSDSTTTQRGIYSFGTLNQWYPDTLSYDYVISTGNNGSTVSIGLVYPIGKDLIVGWKDGIAYGADKVSFDNNPAPYGEIKMLFFDNGNIWKNERSFQAKADFLPLNSGETIAVKANVDRQGWVTSDPATIDTIGDDTFTKLPFAKTGLDGLSREVQIGVDVYATGTTSPSILGLSLLYDDTKEEEQF